MTFQSCCNLLSRLQDNYKKGFFRSGPDVNVNFKKLPLGTKNDEMKREKYCHRLQSMVKLWRIRVVYVCKNKILVLFFVDINITCVY